MHNPRNRCTAFLLVGGRKSTMVAVFGWLGRTPDLLITCPSNKSDTFLVLGDLEVLIACRTASRHWICSSKLKDNTTVPCKCTRQVYDFNPAITVSITCWNVAGTKRRPKGMTLNLKIVWCYEGSLFLVSLVHFDLLVAGFEVHWWKVLCAVESLFRAPAVCGRGYTFFLVILFRRR